MKICIPSYNRAGSVTTQEYLPESWVVVPDSQEREYKRFHDGKLLSIPDEQDGSVSKKRNAILNGVHEDVFMVDDDFLGLMRLKDRSMVEPSMLAQIIENGFTMMHELGAGMFGFNISDDRMKYRDFHPLSLTKQSFWAVGIAKDDIRYDESLKFGEDVDFWLQKLNRYRCCLRFNSYVPVMSRSKVGGIQERHKENESVDRLIQKWGTKIVGRKNGNLYVHTPQKGI